MGGSYSSPPPESTSSIMNAYQHYLPKLTSETAAGIPQIANATAQAATGTQPIYDKLNLDELQKYALPEAQVGQAVANSNALAGAKTNLDQITGPGGQAAKAAYELNRATNPDYYKAQDAASQGAADAVNAIQLGGLSPGEAAAVERSSNQSNIGSGNLGNLNATNTINNALNFGGAFNNKVALKNQSVATASGAANSASTNGGFNGVNVALGQPNVSTMGNMGTSMMSPTNSGTQAGSAGNAFSFGSGLLGNMVSSNNSINSNATQNSIANGPNAYLSSTLGSICCFIFLEAYRGEIPWYVRQGRNKFYYLNHDMATGYRRMARYLVPAMASSTIIRSLVWFFMIEPIASHLAFAARKKKRSAFNRLACHTWLRLWCVMGKGKNEQSYAITWSYPIIALS